MRNKTTNLSTTTFELIKNNIVNGTWQPGEKLPTESQLCEEYGVSRVTIRSALNKLSGLGLIYSIRGSGSYVSSNIVPASFIIEKASPDLPFDHLSLREIHRMFLSESAAISAGRATSAELKEMVEVIDKMKKEFPENIVENNMKFDSLIVSSTKNNYFIQIYAFLDSQYQRSICLNPSKATMLIIRYYELILSAIETRNPILARQSIIKKQENFTELLK